MLKDISIYRRLGLYAPNAYNGKKLQDPSVTCRRQFFIDLGSLDAADAAYHPGSDLIVRSELDGSAGPRRSHHL
jgi:hypothetical protein